MGKRLEYTPNSKIKNVLRQLWLRSRERAATLKRSEYHCEVCGKKQSKAKNRDIETTVDALQVHHLDGINWDNLCDLIRQRLLQHPDKLQAICENCHHNEHYKK